MSVALAVTVARRGRILVGAVVAVLVILANVGHPQLSRGATKGGTPQEFGPAEVQEYAAATGATQIAAARSLTLQPKVGGMCAAIGGPTIDDSFARSESALARFWGGLAWDYAGSGHATGQVATGWGPYDAFAQASTPPIGPARAIQTLARESARRRR